MRQIKVISDQNIIDFVIEHTGSTEGLFDVLVLNDNLGVNSILKLGDIINVPDEPSDENVFNFYEKNELIVTTGETEILGDFNDDFNEDFDT